VGVDRTPRLWFGKARSPGSCWSTGPLWYDSASLGPQCFKESLTFHCPQALFVSALSTPFVPGRLEEYVRQALTPPLLISSYPLFLAYLDCPSDSLANVLQDAIESLAMLLNEGDVAKMLNSIPAMHGWPVPSRPQLEFVSRLTVRIPPAILKHAGANKAFGQLYASSNLEIIANLVRYVEFYGEGAPRPEETFPGDPILMIHDRARAYYRNGLETLGPAADVRLALSYIASL
jgi:hypothetical protein